MDIIERKKIQFAGHKIITNVIYKLNASQSKDSPKESFGPSEKAYNIKCPSPCGHVFAAYFYVV
jgi:hypothetical protein